MGPNIKDPDQGTDDYKRRDILKCSVLPLLGGYPALTASANAEEHTQSNELTITKEGQNEGLAAFALTVTGNVDPTEESEAEIAGNSALDWVGPETGTDSLVFSGDIVNFLLKGSATVRLNGSQVNPGSLGRRNGGGDRRGESVSNTLTVKKGDTEEGIGAFFVSVDGEVVQTENSEAVIEGSSALDWVGPTQGTDTLQFAGDITQFLLKGNAKVILNGEEVDPAAIPSPSDSESEEQKSEDSPTTHINRIQKANDRLDTIVPSGNLAILVDYRREGLTSIRETLRESGAWESSPSLAQTIDESFNLNKRIESALRSENLQKSNQLNQQLESKLAEIQNNVQELDRGLAQETKIAVQQVIENLIRASEESHIGRAASAIVNPKTTIQWYESLESRISDIRQQIQSLKEQGYSVTLEVSEPAIIVTEEDGDPRSLPSAPMLQNTHSTRYETGRLSPSVSELRSNNPAPLIVTGSIAVGAKAMLGAVGVGLGKIGAGVATGKGVTALVTAYGLGVTGGSVPGPQQLIQQYFSSSLFRRLFFTKTALRARACDTLSSYDSFLEALNIDTAFDFYRNLTTGCIAVPDPETVRDELKNTVEEIILSDDLYSGAKLKDALMCRTVTNEDHVRSQFHDHPHHPVDEQYTFSRSTQDRIFAWVEMENVPPVGYEFEWRSPSGAVEGVAEDQTPTPDSGNRWDRRRIWSFNDINTSTTLGEWEVIFIFNDEEVTNISFNIVE